MRYIIFFILTLLIENNLQANETSSTKVLKEDSLEFTLGKETRPNIEIRSSDNPELGVQLGIRFQGTAEWTDPKNNDPSSFDFFGRRVRFEATTQFSKNSQFTMDLRNDNVNTDDGGERNFNIGDAYFVQKKLGGNSLLNFKFYRGKVDVSRTETIKSSWLVYYDRASVADEAAQYVSHNRRAMNAQLYGHLNHKFSYSLAIGDGVQSGSFHDARGEKANSIARQGPMIGAKFIASPIPGWEEKEKTETYFGEGQHASVGLGLFSTSNIYFKPTSSAQQSNVDRLLVNLEASMHYLGFFIQAEHFWFQNTVKDFSATTLDIGKSNGWYVTAEYVLKEMAFLAPFVRYEDWNRFENDRNFLQTSCIGGVNWYLRGNTTRVGLAVQNDEFGSSILGKTDQVLYKITSQLHF